MTTMSTMALRVSGVTKSFNGSRVLDGVDLEVPAGMLTALLGASGSGKTTLLRCITGFERIEAGSIEIAGAIMDDSVRAAVPEQRHVGYVPQDGSLFPHLDVGRNVTFGLPRRQRRSAVQDELLEQVGLAGFARRRTGDLSGGQRQRVAIARALALHPTLILLDEPFAALDTSLRTEIRDEVIGVLRSLRATAVLVTHDQDEALSVADRVAVLDSGRILQEGPPETLYERPADPGLARFLGEANVVSGRRVGGIALTPLGEVALDPEAPTADGPVQVVLRPEQLGLVEAPLGVEAIVRKHRYHGHDAMTHVEVGNGCEVVVRHEPTKRLDPGDTVRVVAIGRGMAFVAERETSDLTPE
jgi:iron(III) transport system ATP-binding protein